MDHIRAEGQLLGGESQQWRFTDRHQTESTRTFGGTHRYHLDDLGSVRMTTNNQGRSLAEHEYLSFGKSVTSSQQESAVLGEAFRDGMRFAGHWRDFLGYVTAEDTEYLDYMHARYYDPDLGRFLSVDPKERYDAFERPQRWNRYAYARNNPLLLIDLDGRDERVGWLYRAFPGTTKHLQEAAAAMRFLSVDPVIAPYAANVPQAWNRYSYVLNNPMRFTDPTGLIANCKPHVVPDGKDKQKTVLRCGEGESVTVERKRPADRLFRIEFPALAAAERRREEVKAPNQSTFTRSQCRALHVVVNREARMGTGGAAAKSSNTRGDRTIGQFNADFNTRGNPTLSSGAMIDVDWFTDINTYTANVPSLAPAAYTVGKLYWRAVGGTEGWPYQDRGESTAVAYASRGASYNEIYNQACP